MLYYSGTWHEIFLRNLCVDTAFNSMSFNLYVFLRILKLFSGGNFYLENGPHRWRQKDYVVIAPDRQGTEAIWNQVKAKNLS